MPGIQRLFYDQTALSLLAEIIDDALTDARKHGVTLPVDAKQRRMLLAEQILRSIESGETDMGRLRELALAAITKPQQRSMAGSDPGEASPQA